MTADPLPTFELFPAHAHQAVAAWVEGGTRTAGELLSDAAAIAQTLDDRAGEVLALCADRYSFAACLLASWLRERVVALPPNTQPGAVRELMRETGIRELLHDGLADRGMDVRPLLGRGQPHPNRASLVLAANRPIATVYTSGSSGTRQPFRKTAGQLLGEALSLARTFGVGPGDRILATVPSQHIYGLLSGVLLPMVSGAAFISGSPLYPDDVARRVREAGATVIASVPAHLRSLTSLTRTELSGVRLILSSGAPLDRETALRLEAAGCLVKEIFGSSETGGIAWRQTTQGERWMPMPGVHVSANAEGQMLVDSPFLDPTWPRPYAGGDCIQVEANGTFQHLGRVDGVVKIAGKRVVVADVERRIRGISGVTDAAIVAVSAEAFRGSELWAAIAPGTLTQREIRTALLQWFDPVVLPRRMRFVDALPREATGKLTRARLLSLFDEKRDVALSLSPDLPFFRGHFEGYPVLPGVAMLSDFVLTECRRAWPELRHLRGIERLKFPRTIRPDDQITLRLHQSAGRVRFEALRGDQVCHSGTLVFEEGE